MRDKYKEEAREQLEVYIQDLVQAAKAQDIEVSDQLTQEAHEALADGFASACDECAPRRKAQYTCFASASFESCSSPTNRG